MDSPFAVGSWAWLRETKQACRIVDRQELWERSVLQAWVPAANEIRLVGEEDLDSIDVVRPDEQSKHDVIFRSAAGRIADSLSRDPLVSPIEGSLIPLPHQVHALARAMSGDRVRYLLADEVGLGKTIEAGLILEELKIRGLVRRCLVVAPAGLCLQWVQEMKNRFGEDFRLVLPGNLEATRDAAGLPPEDNLWAIHDQVVCPLDSVKPVFGRRGWSRERLARYNRERFEDLVTAGWDLVIIDEAHRLAGSTDQVARFRLGEALAEAAPYLLLLSATPHSGKSDSFRRLLALLDPMTFGAAESTDRDQVAPFVIRTQKRHAIDVEGKKLFQPRQVKLLAIPWGDHSEQQVLYEAVTEYVRQGWNRAIREKRLAVGFLMTLFQRLVGSSTRAIRTSLERRLEVLSEPTAQLPLFTEEDPAEWQELDGQEQLDLALGGRIDGTVSEIGEVQTLLACARRCEAGGPDAKAERLLALIRKLEAEENDPELKVLVFTEFVPTQDMLVELLEERGFSVARLNGTMGIDDRRKAEREFGGSTRILVSTDAGGEGLNLQFCHVVVNFDLPWNPMRIEQRIGRVDRIGQTNVVRAFNFAIEESVELRVRTVIEEKLDRILEEFGVDKLGDVLDSELATLDFDDLYAKALVDPEGAAARAEELAATLRREAEKAREGLSVLGDSSSLDPALARSLAEHRIPEWTEQMVVSWLRLEEGHGALVEKDGGAYRLRWPGAASEERVVFDRRANRAGGVDWMGLEDERVRALIARLPVFAPGEAPPAVVVPGVSDKVSGTWTLWEIGLRSLDGVGLDERRFLPLFVAADGRVLGPTSRILWDRLVAGDFRSDSGAAPTPSPSDLAALWHRCSDLAVQEGQRLFEELQAKRAERLARETRRGEIAFEGRRRAIEKVGLPEVRRHRLDRLETDRKLWQQQLAHWSRSAPTLSPILFVSLKQMESS